MKKTAGQGPAAQRHSRALINSKPTPGGTLRARSGSPSSRYRRNTSTAKHRRRRTVRQSRRRRRLHGDGGGRNADLANCPGCVPPFSGPPSPRGAPPPPRQPPPLPLAAAPPPPPGGASPFPPPPPGPRAANPPAPPAPVAAPPPPPTAAPPAPPPAPALAAPPPPPPAAPPPPPPLAAPPPLIWASANVGSMAASAIAVVITTGSVSWIFLAPVFSSKRQRVEDGNVSASRRVLGRNASVSSAEKPVTTLRNQFELPA